MKLLYVLGTVALTMVFCGCKEEAKKSPMPPNVEIMTVGEKDVFQSTTLIAEVKAYDSVELVARVKGELQKRNFADGQRVKKGDLLFEIEPTLYQAELKQAEGVFKKSEAGYNTALKDYERQGALLNKDAISERNFDMVTNRKLEAEAAKQEAAADVDKATLNLSYTKIFAPFDGQVGFCRFSEKNVVGPESGTLVNIAKTDQVRVEFVVPERLYVQLLAMRDGVDKARQHILVQLMFEDGQLYEKEGKIAFWDNSVNSSTGTYKVQALFDNSKYILVPGLFVRVKLLASQATKMMMVPEEAVLLDQSTRYVYVVDKDNKTRRVEVQVGYRDGEMVQILNGLKDGELIVVNGIQRVRPGIKVMPTMVDYVDGKFVKVTANKEINSEKNGEKVNESELQNIKQSENNSVKAENRDDAK